jgi:hypothetical protein
MYVLHQYITEFIKNTLFRNIKFDPRPIKKKSQMILEN